jgi:predicted hydrocarbon binding protein
VHVNHGDGTIDVRGSLFCAIRDSATQPLCGFYAAAISRFLELYRIPGEARVDECRAVGDRSCVLSVTTHAPKEDREDRQHGEEGREG